MKQSDGFVMCPEVVFETGAFIHPIAQESIKEGTNDAERVRWRQRQRHGDGIKHRYRAECHVHGIVKKHSQIEASVGDRE